MSRCACPPPSASLPAPLPTPPPAPWAHPLLPTCSRLEEALPDVFESLQEAYRGADGRMAQELLRRHVLKLLRIWRGWFCFSDDYLNGLQVGAACSRKKNTTGRGCEQQEQAPLPSDPRGPQRQQRLCACMRREPWCTCPAVHGLTSRSLPPPRPPAGHVPAQRRQRRTAQRGAGGRAGGAGG